MPPRPGRLQLLPLPGGAWLLRDDYKSQGETIDAALDVLAEVPGRRIVVIGSVSEPLGSQGPTSRPARRAAGAGGVAVGRGRRELRVPELRSGGRARRARARGAGGRQ